MYSSRRCGSLRTRDDLLGAPISTGVSGMSGSAVGGADSAPLSSSTSPSTSLWSGGGSYGSERNIDTFLVTRDPSARRAVIIEPFRLATTNGVGSNGVDSLPVFCRRTKTTSPSFKVVFHARVRLSARYFIFPLRGCIVFPHNLIIHQHVLPDFGQFCLWIPCEHQSMRREFCCYVGSAATSAGRGVACRTHVRRCFHIDLTI